MGGADVCARALLAAESMIEDGCFESFVEKRYEGWKGETGRRILSGELDMETLFQRAKASQDIPRPVSGKQEFLENALNRYL